jgi:5-methyltetrahydropteroyltriglutamate--homocysteine methyltransferase
MVVSARAEHVGSLLRPAYLLDARREREAGALDQAAFKRVEDRAVREVIALQEEAGCPIVTDGELRRDSFQSELTAAVDGFVGVGMDAWLWGEWHSEVVGDLRLERPAELAVVAPLRRRRSLAAEELAFLRASTDRIAKVTLPSPTLFANLWSPERSREAYPTLDDFMADVVAVLCDEARELARLGCTYLQLDAPHYPLLLDPGWRAFYEARGWPLERWLGYGVELDNAVIDAGRPATFGFHLCRGNQRSRWLVSGGYEPIAGPVFQRLHADRLLLEYDDERSGDFGPLRRIPDDKLIVLGLVTTKTPRMETGEELEARLREAGQLVGMERLALGTQCGFATSALGNEIQVEDERRKLALIVRTAERVLGGPAADGPPARGRPRVALAPMRPEHAEQVLAIYQTGLDTGDASFETEAPSWERWDAGHLPDHRHVALDEDGRVLGWVALSPVSDRCVYAGVAEESVYVHPDARGRGVGLALLRAVVASSEAAGIWALQTGIFPENTASLALHRRAGFRLVGTRRRMGQHHGRWRDVIFLERRSPTVG